MKKIMLLTLGTLFATLLCAVPPAAAQNGVSALEAYAKWRSNSLAKFPKGTSTPHHSVSVVTQRIDATSAKLEMVVVGKMKGYTVEVIPVNLTRKQDGTMNRQEDGEKLKTHMKSEPELSTSTNEINEATVLLPVGGTANAVELQWTPEGIAEGMSYTLILPLEATRSTHVLGLVAPCEEPTETAKSIQKVAYGTGTQSSSTCKCYYAELINERCGSIVACCGSRSAVLDGINCKITCAIKCAPGGCCTGIVPA